VAKTVSSNLCQGISLDVGAGPTVARALTEHQNAYFAMVVQCSLLTAVLEKSSLAQAIKQYFDKIEEGAPSDHVGRATPSEEGIFRVLQACEEQTALYNWRFVLLAVANTLGVTGPEAFAPLPAVVFRGVLAMFPLVQHFPEDRVINIELGSNDGASLLVVWAHHVLSLTVLVYTYWNHKRREYAFGKGDAQVVIDIRSVVNWELRESSITLLESSPQQKAAELLKLEPDPDENKIDATYTIPARGYGKVIFTDLSQDINSGQNAVVEETTLLTCSFAFIIANRLRMADSYQLYSSMPTNEDDSASDEDERGQPFISRFSYTISEARILKAAQVIFDTTKLNKLIIQQYTLQYGRERLNEIDDPPQRIAAIFASSNSGSKRGEWEAHAMWPGLLKAAKCLSVLILAFTHIQDLSSASELPLLYEHEILSEHPLVQTLSTWSGADPIPITELVWFEAVAMLMMGHTVQVDKDMLRFPSLLSNRGWSIFLASFLQSGGNEGTQMRDPMYVGQGFCVVQRGVPSRNGVRKHAVVDGPDKGRLDDFDWQREEEAGMTATLRCANTIFCRRPLYGERRDNFVVTLRLCSEFEEKGKIFTRRTGYAELFSALWTARRSTPCPHHHHSLSKDEHHGFELPPGCSTVSSFGDQENLVLDDEAEGDEFLDNQRVVICLTANNTIARWRALIAIAHSRLNRSLSKSRNVLLRGSDCCLKCVIDQTAAFPGKWFIVL
jgi:hypothetical protein